MKKLISGLTVFSMMALMIMPVVAVELDQDDEPKSTEVEINTTIDPSYVVVIPESTSIDFNAETTELGSIEATWVQIDPDKKVVVTVTPGKLENLKDATKTIPYQLMNGKDEFESMDVLTAGDKVDLNVTIDKADWNKAYAGKYKGIITFTLSYEDIV